MRVTQLQTEDNDRQRDHKYTTIGSDRAGLEDNWRRQLSWQRLLVGAALFAVLAAATPKLPQLAWGHSGVLAHFLAFAALTILSVLAFPKAKIWKLASALCVLGVGIDLLQALPVLHRQASLTDIATNILTVAAVLLTVQFLRLVRIPTSLG